MIAGRQYRYKYRPRKRYVRILTPAIITNNSFIGVPAFMPPLAAAMVRATKTVLADNFVGLGLLQSASYKKSIPTHEKLFAVGKAAQMPLLT